MKKHCTQITLNCTDLVLTAGSSNGGTIVQEYHSPGSNKLHIELLKGMFMCVMKFVVFCGLLQSVHFRRNLFTVKTFFALS